MANEKIIFDTEVKVGSSVGSVKSLKAELRQVTNELANLEEGSAAFVEAAKKAGELKDQIGDLKDTINAFNPEKKFQAIADSVGIAANGFAALQGGMALFGSESEDLNKVMAKTQGAIALATGLNGLLGMKDALKNLRLTTYSAISGLSGMVTGVGGLSGALNALKTTLLTNPLFVLAAVILAIGVALKGFYDGLSSGIEIYKSSAKAVQDLKKTYTSLIDEIKDLQIENDLANGKITQKDAALLKEKNKFKKEFLEIYKDANDKEAEIREQAAKERDDDGTKNIKNLLDKVGFETATTKAARQSLENIEKQKQENIAALRKKYSLVNSNVLIEETKNEVAASLANEEKLKGIAEKKKAENLKIANQKKTNLNAELESLKAIGTRTISELEAQQAIQKKVLDIDLKNKLISNQQYNEGLKKLEIEKAKFIKEREKGTNASIKEAAFEKQQNINETNQQIAKDEIESLEERFKALDALNKQGLLSVKETADAKIAIQKEVEEKDKKELERRLSNIKAFTDASITSLNILSSINEAESNKQKAKYDDDKANLNTQLENRLISRQQYDDRIKALDSQADNDARKAFEENKKIQIAMALVQTFSGAAAAFASAAANPISILGAAYPFIQAGLATAAGLANVAKIQSTQYKSTSTSSGGGGGASPSAPRIPQSVSGTMLNQNKPLDINNTNPTGKVIVVETDITNTQDKVKNIIRKATIK
jgi:hypothetical protein